MNLIYMKYALEVAACGSINKAAEKLYIGQPNLSRAIKELEASLGVAIFERSPQGMRLTSDGEKFVEYAGSILRQVDAVENMFRKNSTEKKHFSVSVPRASYISEAFTAFSARLCDQPAVEVLYQETNSANVVKNVLQQSYKLGIVRYAESLDKYYKEMLDEKGLNYELVNEFQYILLMSARSPFAAAERVSEADLADSIEIAHADPYMPAIPLPDGKKEEQPDVLRRICVYERASQLELLAANPATYMWVSRVPQKLLDRYGLVQRPCAENRKVYKDVMIHHRGYRLTELDNDFIAELCRVKREIFS